MFEQKLSAAIRSLGGDPEASSPRVTLSLRALHRDGRHFPAELFLVVYREESGLEALVLVKDLTHQETVAQELKAVRNSYWALSETVTDPILQISEDFRILFANTAVRSVFGYTAKELINKDLLTLFPPSLHKRYASLIRKY